MMIADIFAEHGVLIAVFLIGLTAGFVDAFVAIGGLFSIPLLILVGLPPHTAVACDRFGMIGGSIAFFLRHLKAGTILWKWAFVFILISLIGGIVGAQIAIGLNPQHFQYILAILVLITLPFLFWKSQMGVAFTLPEKSQGRIMAGLVLFLIIQIFGGFIGAGTGPFFILVLCGVMGLTILQVQGTTSLSWVVLSIASFFIFMQAGHVDWLYCVAMLAGMTLGGYLGADRAIAIGNEKLKKYLALACAISAVALFLK